MKTYQIPVSNTWWLKKKSYFFFVIREMTSLFVAGYCLFLLVFISKVAESQQAYTELLVSLKSPVSITSSDLPCLYSVPCNYMV